MNSIVHKQAARHTDLATVASPPHKVVTCGQSRGGGLTTSNSTRRSSYLGRVAVTYVQGLPKGGGALGVLGVVNTRLGRCLHLTRGHNHG